jgi:hypothetical protein
MLFGVGRSFCRTIRGRGLRDGKRCAKSTRQQNYKQAVKNPDEKESAKMSDHVIQLIFTMLPDQFDAGFTTKFGPMSDTSSSARLRTSS